MGDARDFADDIVVARVSELPLKDDAARRDTALLLRSSVPDPASDLKGYRAILSDSEDQAALHGRPRVCGIRHTDHWSDGDIVSISARRGEIRTLFRPESRHNFIFATDRCNSNCLMCSQPPKDRDDSWRIDQILEMIRLIHTEPEQLGITGGEPTLLGPDLFKIFRSLREHLPTTRIHMLTNGRRFASRRFTQEFADSRHPLTTVAIPLYSDHAQHHDFVVQARGAFDQTVLGLHQLAKYNQSIEIRVVIHQQTANRLEALADFVWRNLPFVSHVALMGLEPMGYTKRNRSLLWIDPVEYQAELVQAVEHLALRGLNVSIYNHQLCVVDRSLWRFCRQSISDWKNIYLPPCSDCSVRDSCGGFFASAERFHSAHIGAIPSLN
jgi:His-Xaa-Ser system radical SAM maturase HxsC